MEKLFAVVWTPQLILRPTADKIRTMSKSLEQGVRQAVEKCLRLRPEESVVIITDRETFGIGSALRNAVEKITPRVKFFIKEDFGSRPLVFPKELESALVEADVSIYAAKGAPGELQIFRMPMLDCVNRNKKLRHGHMVNITPEIMADGMCSDYEEIGRVTRLVYEKVKDARPIRVVTEKGTDFTAEFSPKLKWKLCDGLISPDSWSNLPDGEIFTAPANV